MPILGLEHPLLGYLWMGVVIACVLGTMWAVSLCQMASRDRKTYDQDLIDKLKK